MENIDYICHDCGIKYLTEKQRNGFNYGTIFFAQCDKCLDYKGVSHIRNYNYDVVFKESPPVSTVG